MHDEDDSSEPQDDSSEENSTGVISDISTEITEESKPTEISQVLTVFNKTIHHEDDLSEDKSVTEIETHTENGEKNNAKQDKLLATNFQGEIENQVEGLITYSIEQQIFKFRVNSGNNQELCGVNASFTSYELKWTIDAILQHMGFYPTTEDPCVMMREKIT